MKESTSREDISVDKDYISIADDSEESEEEDDDEEFFSQGMNAVVRYQSLQILLRLLQNAQKPVVIL